MHTVRKHAEEGGVELHMLAAHLSILLITLFCSLLGSNRSTCSRMVYWGQHVCSMAGLYTKHPERRHPLSIKAGQHNQAKHCKWSYTGELREKKEELSSRIERRMHVLE